MEIPGDYGEFPVDNFDKLREHQKPDGRWALYDKPPGGGRRRI
jgi:hypothetical protein